MLFGFKNALFLFNQQIIVVFQSQIALVIDIKIGISRFCGVNGREIIKIEIAVQQFSSGDFCFPGFIQLCKQAMVFAKPVVGVSY